MITTHTDIAYGNEFDLSRNRDWYIRYSFRHPGHAIHGENWVKLDRDDKQSVKHMLTTGRIEPMGVWPVIA